MTFLSAVLKFAQLWNDSVEQSLQWGLLCDVEWVSWVLMYSPHLKANMVQMIELCALESMPFSFNGSNPSFSAFSSIVKPQHPVNVQVTENIDSYNVTWQMDENIYLCFMYRVRITTNNNNLKVNKIYLLCYMFPIKYYSMWKTRFPKVLNRSFSFDLQDPVYYPVREDQRYLVLNSLQLQPGTEYVANVQASVNPVCNYQGPWSEWSSTVEWRTTGTSMQFRFDWSALMLFLDILDWDLIFHVKVMYEME